MSVDYREAGVVGEVSTGLAAFGDQVRSDSFIPIDRRMALQGGRSSPERLYGAVLKADIAGSSNLTERLYQELGPKNGAEHLSRYFNATWRAFISIVHNRGGAVIDFIGDGITCWFPGPTAAITAVAAAFECRNAWLATHSESADIGIKLAVTTGFAHRFAVGFPRLDVIGGAPIRRVESADKLARSNEIVVDWDVLGILEANSESWRSSRPVRPEMRSSDVSDLMPFCVIPSNLSIDLQIEPAAWPQSEVADDAEEWVIDDVWRRIQRNGPESLSEYRFVTTLFVRFDGVDFDVDPAPVEATRRYIEWAQSVVAEYEGILCQLVVGDKGSYFYAAFGAPRSHEDDVARALHAALDLMQPPRDLQITENRAGIASGMMLCGLIGSVDRCTYGVVGAAAVAAARLMETAAPREVRVDSEVARLASSEFEFGPVNEDRSTGRRLVGIRRAEANEGVSPLIGRAGALRTFEEWLKNPGHPQRTYLLLGEAGLGKTRLLSEFERAARSHGIEPLVARAAAISSTTPLAVCTRLVDDLGPTDVSSTDMADTREALEARVDVSVDRSVRALEVALLENSMLVVDDAQWADSASVHVLTRLRTRLPDLRIVYAARPSPVTEGVAAARLKLPERLEVWPADDIVIDVLSPLTSAEARRLAARRLGASDVSDSIAEVLVDKAGGNPFFVEELIASFADDGLIEVEEDTLVSVDDGLLRRRPLPGRVRQNIVSRMSLLEPDVQVTLKAASVIGGVIDLDMLEYVHPGPLDGKALAAQLDDLVQRGIVERVAVGSGSSFEFRHDLLREAAEEMLPAATAAPLHIRAADWLEGRHADDSGRWHSVIAYHLDVGGAPARAIGRYVASAEQAMETAGYTDAVAALSRAIELGVDTGADEPSLARWHLEKGRARVLEQATGEREARYDLEEGLRLLGERVPLTALVPLAVVWHLARHGVGSVGRSGLRKAALGRPVESGLGYEAYEQLAELYYLAREDLRVVYAAVKSLNLARRRGSGAEIARGLASVGQMFGFVPATRRFAEAHLADACSIAEAAGDIGAIIYVDLVRSFYYSGLGRWNEASEAADRATALAEQSGLRRRYEDGLSHQMVQAFFTGDADRCHVLGERLFDSAKRRGAQRNMAYALQGRAYAFLDERRLADVESCIAEFQRLGYGSTAVLSRPDDEALATEVLGMICALRLAQGDLDGAVVAAIDLIGRTRQRPTNFSAWLAHVAPADVAVAVARQNGGRLRGRVLRTATRRLARYAGIFPVGAPALYRIRAEMADVGDAHRRARRFAARSHETALRSGSLVEVARVAGSPVGRHLDTVESRVDSRVP